MHLQFDQSNCIDKAFFSKGEPFIFDNWSPIFEGNSPFNFPKETDHIMDNVEHGEWPLSGIRVTCCEVIFAMKAMINYSGIHRTLASQNSESISEVSRRLWDEGKYRDVDPAVVGDESFLKEVGERELAKMVAVIREGNAEKMKKTGREFSSVFTFGGKAGQSDLRLDGLPWHRIACALLYHLKLRLWLARPEMYWLLTRLFAAARVREVSANDTLYAVVLSKDPKPPGTSPVDPLASGDAAAAAAAGGCIDDDWGNLDEGRGNLLGKVCQAAIASLVAGTLLPDFGAPSAALQRLGFGPLLLTPVEFGRLAAAAAAAAAAAVPGPDCRGGAGGAGAGGQIGRASCRERVSSPV